MSASQYRSQLDRKRKQRADAEKKVGEYRKREADKRTAATKARAAASRSTSANTASMKMREAARREEEANAAAREAASWQAKAAGYTKEEAALQSKVLKAEQAEAAAAERRRQLEQKKAERRAAAETALVEQRISAAELLVSNTLRELRTAKHERLRVLLLGASSEGDLRIGREQARIRRAVETALHRDLVHIDARPSATTADLLDGVTKFRPHVIHFSGHSDDQFIVFEDEQDEQHPGYDVTARAFAAAVKATDDPPLLVLLNSCHSATQIDILVDTVVPFAIGMSDEIDDVDAITYAAQFYAAVANGQSITSAHLSGRAALELAGLPGHELPTLAHAADVDPTTTLLVKPPQ